MSEKKQEVKASADRGAFLVLEDQGQPCIFSGISNPPGGYIPGHKHYIKDWLTEEQAKAIAALVPEIKLKGA